MSWMARRLEDFGELWPAEAKVVAEMGSGAPVVIGETVPPEDAPHELRLRASFVRYLALGGCSVCRTPEKGLRLRGAVIEGDGPRRLQMRGLDLEGCRLSGDLALLDCRFLEIVVLRGARLYGLNLQGSVLAAGLSGDGLDARGDVSFVSIKALAEVNLLGANLGGGLNCSGAMFRAMTPTDGGSDFAFSADRLEAAGGVVLEKINCIGQFRLLGANLGGDLDCEGATFRAAEDVSGSVGYALNADGLRARGAILLRKGTLLGGVLDLTDAEVGSLCDAPECWPSQGNLLINRFRYGAFVGRAPVDAESRLEWLARQDPVRWGQDFWPQPYVQCAKVLREMGHEEDARAILIEKERRQRAARRERASGTWRHWLRLWDGMIDVTIRFGHQSMRAFLWIGFVWAVGTFWFGLAATQDALKPSSPVVLRSAEWVLCGAETGETVAFGPQSDLLPGRAAPGQSQRACFRGQPEAAAYPGFNAVVYALDTLLPIASLQQQEFWIPDETKPYGAPARVYLWFHILAGWALSLLAVAGFSGLVRSD